MERTLVLLKPDALQRNLLGEIVSRFERKGLKIVGIKMMKLSDEVLADHYSHHRDKPFFGKLVNFMQSAPVVAMVLEGIEAIGAVRLLCGPTSGRKADAGSIRGDFSMSVQHNIVHASDSLESAEKEIWRFFNQNEIFDYPKIDLSAIYGEEDLEK
ncbi:MAG: nucleoside-diphosphate kinase [Patescibacteria group bacterium]|nr:nucleoside-diphosphate kinase [Patescibacteria group bacterium]MDD5164798.1 nucleoside-diphosphate kinase [Patescibacteria group bacterium]MDD5534780.1 nucleoside-diphosphate kinase [Patescibacteria group bacterium]